MEPEKKDGFIRWQKVTIDQLTYAVNLIFGSTVAALGFQMTLLLNKEFTPMAWQKCVFSSSLVLLCLSACLGIFVVINRLRDFRLTAKISRSREQEVDSTEISKMRDASKKLGDRTWLGFIWQLMTFGAGIVLTVVTVIATQSAKLL